MWLAFKKALDNDFFRLINNWILGITILAIFLSAWLRPNYLSFQLESFPPDLVHFIFFLFYILLLSYTILSFTTIKRTKLSLYLYGLAILLLTISPPLLSMDIGGYILGAKNIISPDSRTYLDALRGAAPWAKEMSNIWWLDYPTVYGPTFQTIALTSLIASPFGLLATILIYKLIGLAGFLSVLYLFWLIARDRGLEERRLWLLALNPALLINWLLEGHNDIFIALGLLGTLYCLDRKKLWPTWLLFTLTIFIKYTALIFSPILFFKNNKFSLKNALGFLLLTGLAFLAFFKISGLSLSLFSHNLFFLNQCFYHCSPLVYLFQFTGSAQFIIRLALFAILYVLITWRYLYKQTDYLKFIFWSGLALFFVQTTWLTPWYPTIIIPIGLLIKDKKYLYLVILVSWYSLLHYFGL